MPEHKWHHVHVMSPNPEKTADFYVKMFGARKVNVMKAPDGSQNIILQANGGLILVGGGGPPLPSYGLAHVGFSTDDIKATVAKLKADGVKFQKEITEVMPGIKYAFFWGPDNVLFELVEQQS